MTRLRCMRIAMAIALVLGGGMVHEALAQSLAGKVGEERRKMLFPQNSQTSCKKGYDAYIAAPGHSAYAATPDVWGASHIICSWTLNVRSKKAAEKSALKGCNDGLKEYKVEALPECGIVASK